MDDDSRIGRPPRSEEASSARLVARVTAESWRMLALSRKFGETLFGVRFVGAFRRWSRERVRKNMG